MKELYQYQKEDVEKLLDLPYGLIASEMGTGKSYEGIALSVEWLKQVYEGSGKLLPILIICPINTFSSWADKFAEQCPALDVKVIDRKYRGEFLLDIVAKKHDVYIMHWAGINYLAQYFKKYKIVFSAVVADEVHAIANRNSKTKSSLASIKTYSKLGLSGTPCGDKPWQLWSILNWLDPERYSSYWTFVNRYVEEEYEIVKRKKRDSDQVYYDRYRVFKTPKNLSLLHRSIEPFYVRHLKIEKCCDHHPDGVMSWLPEKTYETLTVELSPKQRKAYNEMRDNMVAWLGEVEDTPLVASIVVAQLTRLGQMTLATPLVTTEPVEYFDNNGDLQTDFKTYVDLEFPSTKFNLLKDIVTEYEEKQFLVFTSSKKMAKLTVAELNRLGISAIEISGDTPEFKRQALTKEFAAKKFRIIVAVIVAAAEGIDGLQDVCDTAIFLDRSYRTIKNMQAEDRLHRGGQTKRVTIIDIVAEDTVDIDRQELLATKWQNIKMILDRK